MDQAISAMGYGIWDMGYGIWDMGYGICTSIRSGHFIARFVLGVFR